MLPGTGRTGYFALIFNDAQGRFASPLPENLAVPVMITVRFPGDADHLAAAQITPVQP